MTEISHAEPKGSGLEVARETFLAKLNEPDRANILNLQKIFERILRNRDLKGALLAVGGILTKPLPRKDIDIAVIIESDRNRQRHESSLKVATEKFQFLLELSGQIIKMDPSFSIAETFKPTIDEEFGTPSILKHNGSLKLKKPGTTPIELINTSEESTDEAIRQEKLAFCVVAKI